MLLKKTLFAFTLLCYVQAHAQLYDARHYQVENGLSNNAVICSLQDKKGFLWFGTKDGLNRFDGYAFKVFRNNPEKEGSIGNNFIHCLYQDTKGILWVGTENGLYRYDAMIEQFSLVPMPVTGLIREIQNDAQGNIWFISNFTLYRYNELKKQLTAYPAPQYFNVTSVCTSSDGTVWAATPAGMLMKYFPASNSFISYNVFQHSKPTVSAWIEKIYSTSKNEILIGTSNQGAKIFDVANNTYSDILTYNEDKTELFVRNFLQTSGQEIWMATESGIFIYNLATAKLTNLRKRLNDPYSLSDNAVYTFCKDNENGIWAGTYFGGINYFPRQQTPFKKIFPRLGENALNGNVVREICQDHTGSIWIGTEDAGLNKLDTGTGIFTHFLPTGQPGSISYSNIHGLLADGNELWIGTFEHGLDVMNITTGKVIRHYVGNEQNNLKSNFIYCIYKTSSGEIMLGTTRGAFIYNRNKNDFDPLPGLPMYNWYTSMVQDEKGRIWAGTFGIGVQLYDTHTHISKSFMYDVANKNSLASNRVNGVFEDSEKRLWFATEEGLCKYEETSGGFTRYTTTDGFPSNFIISLLEDDRKNLWISTTKGLVCFNPQTEKLTVYTSINGLLSDQFNFSSAYKDAAGNMYFGSARGLISFNPKSFSANKFIFPVYLTGFQVNNQELVISAKKSPLQKSISYTADITLSHNQSTFSIDFAALSYTAQDMTEYAYKMEGLDKDWTYLKSNRKVYFTEVAAGNYTFRVKASNGGTWNPVEAKLNIEILPPWWARWWAYTLYFTAAIVAAVIAIRNYHQRVEEKNRRKIELLQIAKEKEIFKAKIEFFTNVAHEIRTPLTLIKGPLEKVIKKANFIPELQTSLRIMERNTNRLIDLTNQLLDFRQTEIKGFRLSFVKTNISELLEETYSNFKPVAEQKNLQYRIVFPAQPVEAYVDPEAVNKILNNLLSNAVKYAEQFVYISLLPVKDGDVVFTMLIKNDGYLIPYHKRNEIFEPFFRLKETEKQKGTGIGLALARSLAELHKGKLELLEPEPYLNVFSLNLPLHQENEFKLYEENAGQPLLINENNIQ